MSDPRNDMDWNGAEEWDYVPRLSGPQDGPAPIPDDLQVLNARLRALLKERLSNAEAALDRVRALFPIEDDLRTFGEGNNAFDTVRLIGNRLARAQILAALDAPEEPQP